MLAYWHWVILGFSMIALEVTIPGAFFIWIGIAALILGSTTFLFPLMSLTAQLLLFGVAVPLVTVLGRRIVRLQADGEVPATLNRRGQQFVGRTIVLDSKWTLQGPDLPSGSVVKVVGVEGNMLIVAQESI
jgi:inner membrane protein